MSETEKKPKFRHVAVNGKKSEDGTQYAEKLTETMNKLVEDGYAIQLSEYDHFTVVIGVHVEERPAPAPPARTAAGGVQFEYSESTPGPRTVMLLQRFQAFADSMSVDAFVVEVKKQAPQLTKGFSAEELAVAAKEIEDVLAEHLKKHVVAEEHGVPVKSGCAQERLLRATAETLRSTVQLQLQ